MDTHRRATAHYEAFVCSNPSCRGYRWADVARLRGETHCIKCNSKFKKLPELRPYYQVVGTKGTGKGANSPPESKGGKWGQPQGRQPWQGR